eukprot:scpid52834/ scgid17129/ Alanine--glyoxylate aminotransferase 2, mitochondrial; (R)-3-amino-2-methylpropionate--pyruvate transaminase; Beta-ALAAT II; Beta-alanine-pyruvate aminotransferase; D-AIBAT
MALLGRKWIGLGRVATWSRSASSVPEMPKCDFQPQKYTGPDFMETMKLRQDYLSPALLTYYKKHVMVNQGHMQWLYDVDDRRYLDLFGGIVTVSVGHCHPKVTAALHEQARRLWHTTNIYLHPGIHEYGKKLADRMPGNLKVCYFTNSGSEANDVALKMARIYTKAHDIISLRNGYHGAGTANLPVLSLSAWKPALPQAFGAHQTMNPDVYRGPWGGARCRDSPIQTQRECNCGPDACEANERYVNQLNDVLLHSVPKRIAGFLAEPIQGVGGTVQFPKDFLKRSFDLVRERGGLCIADEVQTGFGRLGSHYWGFEAAGVTPDIVTMAKGIANGFPMGAVVTTPEIASVYENFLTFNTFGGNPLSCAVASSVLDVIDEENMQANCEDVGTYFLQRLASLRDEFEIVGDVRGKGLMIGVEFVEDKESRTPLDKQLMGAVWEECKDLGVLFGKGGNFGNVSTYTHMMLLLRFYFVSQTMMMIMMCYAMLPCLPQTQA